jgi:cytochrome c5
MMNTAKKILTTLMITFLLASISGVAVAAEAFTSDGNDRKGKYLFRKSCRTCHDSNSQKELSPNTKTQAQWERTFKKYERLECKDEWAKHKQGDLNDIYTYLYNHAYDSPQPATCQ